MGFTNGWEPYWLEGEGRKLRGRTSGATTDEMTSPREKFGGESSKDKKKMKELRWDWGKRG